MHATSYSPPPSRPSAPARPGERPDWVLKTSELANGQRRREYYDFRRRLQRVEEPDGSSLRYRYDAQGKLASLESSTGERAHFERGPKEWRARTDRSETRVRFDERGFPIATTLQVDGHVWTTEYRRDERGRLVAVLYPGALDWLQLGERVRCGDTLYAELSLPRCAFGNGTCAIEELHEGPEPKLRRIAHLDASGDAIIDRSYDHDEAGRITRAGARHFSYDAEGRLSACDDVRYAFDAEGRMIRAGGAELGYGSGPLVAHAHGATFEYDAVGRRSARHDATGTTRYGYNLFGQLARVERSDSSVEYLYDGFGRLIGRQTHQGTVYYVLDVDGRRLAECDASGQPTRTYLWLGAQCFGQIDGPCGGPLARSFHRVQGGTLAGIGDAHGKIAPIHHDDAYGGDLPILDGVPGYAGLFGDPDTGLLHAMSRWLDPAIAQFTSPDSWYGTHALDRLSRGLRPVLNRLPGGTACLLDAGAAYSWCRHDPVNYADPNGHHPAGIVWSLVSACVWQTQVTSLALQMELVGLALWILFTFPVFMPAWNTEFWLKVSPFQAIPPLLGSARLGVPFAFPLNSIWNASGNVFTMGSVIWANGEQLATLEDTAQRDLLRGANIATYQAAAEAIGAGDPRARSPHVVGTATVDAAGTQLTAVALTTPAGIATGDVFRATDWLAVRLPAPDTSGYEVSQVALVGAGTLDLTPALPPRMRGQAIELARADRSVVKIVQGDKLIARTVASVRGQVLHFLDQIPDGFPVDGLTVTEYMPSARRRDTLADAPPEHIVVRFAAGAQRGAYAATNAVRIRADARYFARVVVRLRGTLDAILDAPLTAPALPTDYGKIEIVKLDPSTAVAGQTASGNRVGVGNATDLRKFDGLAIENTGAAAVVTERRIALQLFLRCALTALPAALHSTAIAVDLMSPDASVKADGKVSGASQVTTTAGQATRFSAGQPVRVRKAPDRDFFTVVKAVTGATNRIELDEALPGAQFANGDAVTIVLMIAGKSLEAENTAAPGDQVLVKVDVPTSPAINDVLRVRKKADAEGGALRRLTAAPVVVAELDSALPATHTANLGVRRLAPVQASLQSEVAAPPVQLRFTVQGGANPYVKDDELHFAGPGGEAWGKIFEPPVGQRIVLVDPIDILIDRANVSLEHVTVTGRTTAGATLEESLIMIPSDPGEEPVTRRRAVELHEMQHVWQYALLGPLFLSLPLPWLVDLGFSFTDDATTASKWTRHFGVGALDSLFAAIAWGAGTGGRGPTDLEGEVLGAERKIVQFPSDIEAERFADFGDGIPCDVAKDDYDSLNFIESFELGTRRVALRFALESDRFAIGDKIKVSVSPFEKIRSEINKWFSLNLERLWSDHIPQAWGRALSRLLNRDSWFPLIGVYPICFLMAGNRAAAQRIGLEQDASYKSGDLYTNLGVGSPNEIFVGEFARLLGFMQGRGAGDVAVGLSDANPLEFLTVETPAIAGVVASDMVAGSIATPAANRVRFRDSYFIPLHDKVENAVGAFFAASRAGVYNVHVRGELTASVVGKFLTDIEQLRRITVKSLEVSPVVSAAQPIYETERVRFEIRGTAGVEYRLRYKGAAPAPAGTIDGTTFTAPVLPTAVAPAPHTLEITVTYPDNHDIFRGAGQSGPSRLTAEQRTNVCQDLLVAIGVLAAPAIGPVQAGKTAKFRMGIAPSSVKVTSALPAGAAVNANVVNGVGRNAELTFIAPNKVTAATDVTFEMSFGSGAVTKKVTVTVRITP